MRVWNNYILLFLFLLLAGFQTVKLSEIRNDPLALAYQQENKLLSHEVPVLCYHNFTLEKGKNITVSQQRFEEHIKSLADSGYQYILPEQLYEHLAKGKRLPPKPIIISFDDSRATQYNIAAPVLEKYGFKGVFFIMTICLDKPGYMTRTQLRNLSLRGHAIAAHTYDHSRFKNVLAEEWEKQLSKPKLLLENIVGKPVLYFAYPNGTWSEATIQELKRYGYKAAFQLNGKRSTKDPLYTIRRVMVDADYSAAHLHRLIKTSFH